MKTIYLISILLSFSLNACKTNPSTAESRENKISNYNGTKFPEPIGYVNDFDQVLTSNQIKTLDSIISNYEKKTTREIVVVTLDSIGSYDNIQHYATELGQQWGVGKRDTNNGLSIVLSVKMRKIGIATGIGTENILTDQICKSVIEDVMIPEFKENDYYAGIKKGLAELIRKWN